jgi:hypothetical protein
VDYALIAAVVWGLIWTIHVARDLVPPDDELTPGGLRTALTELRDRRGWKFWKRPPMMFDPGEIERKLDECYSGLQDQAVFRMSESRKVLRSHGVRRHLRRLYSEVMGRPDSALWDPSGYVHWGAMIWRASWAERPEVLRYVKRRMEVHQARGQLS